MHRWYRWSGLAIVLVLAIVLDLDAESKVGSAEIGRDTMKMYRQKQTGQTELTPRRVQSSAAPKRTFQEQQAAAEAAAKPAPAEQPTPAPDATAQPTPAIVTPAETTTETKPAETAMVPAVTPTEPKPQAVAAQPAKDDLLGLFPNSTFACVRVNNLDYTLALIDQYLMGLSPVPMVATIGVRTGLAQITQDQNLQAVNTGGNLGLIVLPPAGQGDPQAVLLTPYKGADSAAALQAASIIPVPNTAYGFKGLTPSPLAADVFKGPSLQSALNERQQEEAASAPIWLYVNLPKALEFVAPLAEAKMKEQAAANPQLSSAMAQTEKIKEIGKEIQAVSISVYPSGAMMTLDIDMIPVAGSKFAGSLKKEMFSQPLPADADAMTKGMVDLMQSLKVQDTAAVKEEAIAGIRNADKADFIATFTIPDLVGKMIQIAAKQPGQEQNAMAMMMAGGIAQEFAKQSKTKMAMAFTVQEKVLNMQIAIPKKHVVELVQAAKALQQQMNQGAPQGGAAQPAGTKPMSAPKPAKSADPNQPAGAEK